MYNLQYSGHCTIAFLGFASLCCYQGLTGDTYGIHNFGMVAIPLTFSWLAASC